MRSRVRPLLLAPVTTLAVVALLGCTAQEVTQPDRNVVTVQPEAGTTVIAEKDASARAIAASRALFESAPVVVVAPKGDAAAQALSARAAVALGVPLLVAPSTRAEDVADDSDDDSATPQQSAKPAGDAVSAEIDRLAATTVVAVGDVRLAEQGDGVTVVESEADAAALSAATGVDIDAAGGGKGETDPADEPIRAIAELPVPERRPASESAPPGALDALPVPAAPVPSTIARTTDDASDAAPLATVRAAGVPAVVVPAGSADPLASSEAISALHDAAASSTLLIGAAFSGLREPNWAVRSATSGAELPGGGQRVFADRLYVALYGAPGAPVLGVLGEQDVAATIERARQVAAPYEALTDRTVVPTLEVIATVAAGAEGDDGNFSNELPASSIEPYIDAAADAGMYVLIDLQPGRTDFLTQAKLYADLLARPNVGLALDPEWRLEPDERHLAQIGSVTADEINAVSDWLAGLVDREGLPPKMLVLHQFRLDMIQDRQNVDVSHPQLELLIHADGQGGQPDKQATWRALHDGAPAGIAWGWKNFYDEDLPMLTPEQTMRDVTPEVDLVTYQ